MSSATIHLVVPTLALMATGLFPRKKVLAWAPFTLVPDLDFVFNFFGTYVLQSDLLLHRAIAHNVFIGIPTLVLAVVLWRRMLAQDPALATAGWMTRWRAFGEIRWAYPAVLVTIYLETHVLFDLFAGGITPFWPLWDQYVYPRFFIFVNTQTGQPSLESSVETGSGAPALSPVFPWLTPEHIAILIVAVVATVIAIRLERTTNPPAAVDEEPTSAAQTEKE